MRQIYPEETRGKAMGSVRMAGSVATMLAAAIGGKLLDLVGFQAVFPAAALAGVAASWIFAQIPYPKTPQVLEKGSTFPWDLPRLLKRQPQLRRFEAGFSLFGFGNLMMTPLVPLLLVDHFQASNFFVGKLAFVTALARLASLYPWGHRIDQKGGPRVAQEILLLISLVPLCFALAQGPFFLYLAAAVSGCAMAGLELAVISSVISLANGRDPTTTMAVHQTVLGIRGTTAPMVGTLLLHLLDLREVFLVSWGLILLGFLLLCRLHPHR